VNRRTLTTALTVVALLTVVWVNRPDVSPKPSVALPAPEASKAGVKPHPTPKAKGSQRRASEPRASRTAGSRYKVRANTPSKRYARGLVSQTQWPCLHELWMRESGWSPTSDNPTSSAYGIPQILGLEKRTGDNYRKQVDAGLAYINHRYGTPCRAWSFWTTHRWY
jgi:hypothetical protein